MSGNLKLAFVIDAIDNATKTLRAVNESVDKINAPMRSVRASAREMFREAGWDKFKTQLGVVHESAQRLGNTVRQIGFAFGAATALAGGAFSAIKNTVDTLAGVADTAEKLGVSTEALSRLQFAAEQSGSSAQEMAESMRFLSDNMTAARGGSKEAQKDFALLGISMAQLNKMKVTDVFERMAQVYNEVGDAGHNAELKISNAQNLMGRGGAKLIQTLNGGKQALREQGAESDRLGYTVAGKTAREMKAFNDTFNALQASIRGVMTVIASAALPALDRMTKKFTEMNVKARTDWAEKFGKALGDIIENLPGFMATIGQVTEGVAALGKAANAVAEALGGWKNVLIGIAAIMGLKAVVGIVQLGIAIGGLVGPGIALAKVVGSIAAGLLSVVGLPALIAVGLVAAAIAIVKYWEPISQFFSDIWEKIKAIGAAAGNGIAGLFGGQGGPAGTAAVASQAPSALPATGRPTLDGQIRIYVDSEGRPRVQDMSTKTTGPWEVDMVYQGPGMAFSQ